MFHVLPLVVLILGVVMPECKGNQSNGTTFQPIITESQQQRICADLCQAGLGGEPCGQVCFDLMPSGIPLQSSNNNTEVRNTKARRRSDACPILCENRLGYPFCQCKQEVNTFRVDFQKICDYYCQHQNWELRGCTCSKNVAKQNGGQLLFSQDGGRNNKMLNYGTSFQVVTEQRIDWEKWCKEQCSHGDGGSACNCDILPFSIN